jgi:molybdopterin/thiamine biosynthesis adenylyltransferase
MWSKQYTNLTTRNIGLLTEEQQEKLRRSTVAVCGLGGIGGVPAEILARTGIGALRLLDHGTFEPSNANRQIFSFNDTNDRLKTDVAEEFLKKINPEISIEKYTELTEDNVERFLDGVDVIVLGIDSVIPCLIVSRAARRLDIPLVEGWAIPFGNVRVITRETPTLEELYGFDTADRDIASITAEEAFDMMIKSLNQMSEIDGVMAFYPPSAVERLIEKREGTTFAPMVWLTSVMMSLETTKLILGWGDIALAPDFAVYDPFRHRMVETP